MGPFFFDLAIGLASRKSVFVVCNHVRFNQPISAISTSLHNKTCIKQPLSKIGFLQEKLSLNAGQKYCRMLQEEHSATLSTFSKLPFVSKIFVLSIFEWPFSQILLYNIIVHEASLFIILFRDQIRKLLVRLQVQTGLHLCCYNHTRAG